MIRRQDTRIGELRPSQMISTFGVGSMVDLPHVSAIVMGTEEWAQTGKVLSEPRLLAAVQRRLQGRSTVRDLRQPPVEYDNGNNEFEPTVDGVTVSLFPQWMRCPVCDTLAPMSSGLFELKPNPRFPDRTRIVHQNCRIAQKPPTVIPARFLVACDRGHVDDFPWVAFVHRNQAACRDSMLKLRKIGPSDEAADLLVECDCGQRRNLADAFPDQRGENVLGACRGRHPHLRRAEACGEQAQAISLGASNSWFSISLSALALPLSVQDKLGQLVETHWDVLTDIEDVSTLAFVRKRRMLPQTFDEFSDEAILASVATHRAPLPASPANVDPEDLKGPEWAMLVGEPERFNSADFRARRVAPPSGFEDFFEDTLMLDRLREVRAIIGFTRIEPPGEIGDAPVVRDGQFVPLGSGRSDWVPASEVRGEGIFIRFRDDALTDWCARADVLVRDIQLRQGYDGWRQRRGLPRDSSGYPGLRMVLIHSFSHALMRQIALSAGYAAASIRERVYARTTGGFGPMAGLLLYTAAADSEGTLGGLVALGEPDRLGQLIGECLEQMRLCAGDPLCADHDPTKDDNSLHGAACHACLFAPETSCEFANRFLDRLLLTDGLGNACQSFFARN